MSVGGAGAGFFLAFFLAGGLGVTFGTTGATVSVTGGGAVEVMEIVEVVSVSVVPGESDVVGLPSVVVGVSKAVSVGAAIGAVSVDTGGGITTGMAGSAAARFGVVVATG